MHVSTLVVVAGLLSFTTASYVLEDRYYNLNFWSKFSFFTGPDPQNGYVNYTDQTTAQRNGIINTGDNGNVFIGVDHTNTATGRGRSTVRLESLTTYHGGLFVFDLAHMPGGICGVWPTISLLSPNGSELSIMSGTNTASQNLMSLRTTTPYAIAPGNAFSGSSLLSPNCATTGGCAFRSNNPNSYGTGFNSDTGGFYAVEWTNLVIRVWFWPRGSAPADLASASPNPRGWGLPLALFWGGFPIGGLLNDARILIATDFCGLAGTDWVVSGCAQANGGSCETYVRDHPGDFFRAYWTINSIQVYRNAGA